jgi:hypothetical protein
MDLIEGLSVILINFLVIAYLREKLGQKKPKQEFSLEKFNVNKEFRRAYRSLLS